MLIEIVLIERKKQASNKLIEIETHHNPKALHSQKNQNDDKIDDSFIFFSLEINKYWTQTSSEQTSDIVRYQKAQVTQKTNRHNQNTQHLDHQLMSRLLFFHLIHSITVYSYAISFLFDLPFTLNQIIGEAQEKSSGCTRRIEPQQGRHPNRNRYRRPGRITRH